MFIHGYDANFRHWGYSADDSNSTTIQCGAYHFIFTFVWPSATNLASYEGAFDIVYIEILSHGFFVRMFRQVIKPVSYERLNQSDLAQGNALIVYAFSRNCAIPLAAILPISTASTTSPPPLTQSPPAKRPFTEVAPVLASTATFLPFTSRLGMVL